MSAVPRHLGSFPVPGAGGVGGQGWSEQGARSRDAWVLPQLWGTRGKVGWVSICLAQFWEWVGVGSADTWVSWGWAAGTWAASSLPSSLQRRVVTLSAELSQAKQRWEKQQEEAAQEQKRLQLQRWLQPKGGTLRGGGNKVP